MPDLMPFESFLDLLPEGAFHGNGTEAFGIAARPDIFIPPTLAVVDQASSPGVTLISARGATGKSTLALQLSAAKQVPVWRLDSDYSVSADALEGRLARYIGPSDPVSQFRTNPSAFIIIDSLDEARMRVSGLSWKEFIDSLIRVSDERQNLVLLGRERILEDVWVSLSEDQVSTSWFEISHFDSSQRTSYVDLRVAGKRDTSSEPYQRARDSVIEALSTTVDQVYADSFVGYAPVLDAVAALLQEGNLLAVSNAFSGGTGDRRRLSVLVDILNDLLIREQGKTSSLAQQFNLEPKLVYTPSEQVDWLMSDLVGADPPSLNWCPPERRSDYSMQIQEFVRDHPFRSESSWASPVFSAYVAAKKFHDPQARASLQPIADSTGLLFEFVAADGVSMLDEWQFAALHASLLAAEWQAAEAVVSVDAADPYRGQRGDIEQVPGELMLVEGDSATSRTAFELILNRENELMLMGPLSALSVTFPADVLVPKSGRALTLGPDLYIRCRNLELTCDTVQVSRRSRVGDPDKVDPDEADVVLEVTEKFSCIGTLTGSPPPRSFELRVSTEQRLFYPWVSYRADLEPPSPLPNDRAVRFLNMFMNLVRRHGHKGAPAVFYKKLEGRQSVKGPELDAVLEKLERLGVVVHGKGQMIYLTPEWEGKRFSGQARQGIVTLTDSLDEWSGIIAEMSAILEQYST